MALSEPCFLLTLSDELLVLITRALHPSAHLKFAITSKRLFQCSQDVLSHHRQCAQRYAVCTDRDPQTFLANLRTVLEDPIAAWHVRNIEFWGQRLSWADWKPYGQAGQVNPVFRGNTCFEKDELSSFRSLLSEVFHLGRKAAYSSQHMIEVGYDKHLKLLLIALCPRLNRLAIVANGVETSPAAHNSVRRGVDIEFLRYLATLISRIPAGKFPPGLLSLRSIVIGADSKLRRPLPPWRIYRPLNRCIVPLTQLLNIETLHISELGMLVGDEGQWVDSMQAGSSACEVSPRPQGSSTLHTISILSAQAKQDVIQLLSTAKALKAVCVDYVHSPDFDFELVYDIGYEDEIPQWLSKHHSSTLKTLRFSLADTLEFHGQSIETMIARLRLQRMWKLRHLHLGLQGMTDRRYVDEAAAESHFDTLFDELPDTLEVLAFDSPVDLPAEIFDAAVAKFICQAKCPRLKALLLDWPEDFNSGPVDEDFSLGAVDESWTDSEDSEGENEVLDRARLPQIMQAAAASALEVKLCLTQRETAAEWDRLGLPRSIVGED